MNQLTQKLKNGKMQVLEVPIPSLQKGHILVRNHYSLISAGTEGSTVKAARKGGEGPMSMIYRINAGCISPDSWIQDTEFGGGRIIGEVCHFVEFLTFMNGSLPVSVYAAAMKDHNTLNDVLNISLQYENGSIGTICYFANGDKSLTKERVEIYATGCTAVLNDFKTLAIHAHGKKKKIVRSG